MARSYHFPEHRIDEWLTFQRKSQRRRISVPKAELDRMIRDFDPNDYADRLELVRARTEANEEFREPDRVPIYFSVSGSFFCKLKDGDYASDVNLRDYYGNMELAFEVQLGGLRWAFEELRDDRTGGGLHAEFGPVGEGVLFGFKIIYPDDTSPWVVRELQKKEDVERFIRTEVPHPEEHPGLRYIREISEKARERVHSLGGHVGAGAGIGIHPPLSAACALMEPVRVIKLMYTDPDLIHRFFKKLADEKIRMHQYDEKQSGSRSQHFGLADDHMLMISPQQYREFEMPHVKRMYRRFGAKSRHLHGDGPNDHLFEIMANEVRLTHMDIGGFSNLERAARTLQGKVRFSGGLNSKDFYVGTPFTHVKSKLDHCLEVASRGSGYTIAIGGETYVRVDPSLLKRAVRYVEARGKQPRGT